MDSRFSATRDELYNVQMDVKQIYVVQNSHAERLSRLEKRQADDAAIKSAWNSPFPSALGGTPQHGPVQMPPDEIFDNFDEQGQNLLGSLDLDAEDEPTRRGAASRANSVRFDESALHGSSWAQNGRQSGDFGPIRPGSGLGTHGMMERSMSHKSDGRHSSAGHSVHSIHSHHSVASGRGSSLGLDTTFAPGGQEEDSPVGVPEPPPSFFVLGSVPSIVRCWLTRKFSHDTLLYADICTGSQKSTIEFSLIKDLDLVESIQRESDGIHRIRLNVFLTEATVSHAVSHAMSHANSRSPGTAPPVPRLGCTFEVAGMDQPDMADAKKAIRIFIGSEALRGHSADVLFSQNRMTLYSSDREKLSVPFVRPEDHGSFKNIRTIAVFSEKPKLNATARPFVLGESKPLQVSNEASEPVQIKTTRHELDPHEIGTPTSEQASQQPGTTDASTVSESGGESERPSKENSIPEHLGAGDGEMQPQGPDTLGDGTRRASGAGSIWNSWRQGTVTNGGDQKEGALLSGYQPVGRGRNMKVLKPTKSTSVSSSARTGAAYEPAPAPRGGGELRRKSQTAAEGGTGNTIRWEAKRASIGGAETNPAPTNRESRSASGTPRTSTNPVGGASAFSWMTPASRPRAPATATE
ncbi:putative ubiquitin carboxyl-terminal hydrolase 19 [Rosellinia necatrix]|uniref:Putative ubiquitin carboxyl-terminal hydrolase 19 n=1 Tax=Rosellinia necatrix TaxID=77044 RepID=A0A1W2TNU4_ROSNE|nr:putative ubiquitin carboxyl-terminal hydrolase 19 [Rosellinia necatrix]